MRMWLIWKWYNVMFHDCFSFYDMLSHWSDQLNKWLKLLAVNLIIGIQTLKSWNKISTTFPFSPSEMVPSNDKSNSLMSLNAMNRMNKSISLFFFMNFLNFFFSFYCCLSNLYTDAPHSFISFSLRHEIKQWNYIGFVCLWYIRYRISKY